MGIRFGVAVVSYGISVVARQKFVSFHHTKADCLMARGELEPVQILCPKCRHTEIIYLPVDDLPKCPDCGTSMMLEELLDEGKAY